MVQRSSRLFVSSRAVSRTAVVAAVVLVVAAAGCAGSKTPVVNVATGTQTAGVTVTGSGRVSGAPDTLRVSLGVSVLRPSVGEATDVAGERAQAVISALAGAGVDKADIQTTNYSIAPEYDFDIDPQTPTGYRVSNTVSATLRDVDAAGETIDAAVQAGGNAATVQGVTFELEDNADAIASAREEAFAEAKATAQQFADLADRPLGAVQSINQNSTTDQHPVPYAADAELGTRATPIEPGEVVTEVTVSVRWSFG